MSTLEKFKAIAKKRVPVEGLEEYELEGVFVQEITAKQRFEFEKMFSKKNADGSPVVTESYRAKLVEWCCVNEDGARIFDSKDGRALLDELPAPVVDTIFNAAGKLNKLTQDEVKEVQKNSEETEKDSSTSA